MSILYHLVELFVQVCDLNNSNAPLLTNHNDLGMDNKAGLGHADEAVLIGPEWHHVDLVGEGDDLARGTWTISPTRHVHLHQPVSCISLRIIISRRLSSAIF